MLEVLPHPAIIAAFAPYPRGLCRHCHLVVHYAQHRGLQHLCLYNRAFHYYHRLGREHDLAFTHSVDVAGELHVREVLPELCIFVPGKELPEEIRRHAAQVLHHFQHFVHAADNGPVVVFRGFPVEKIEYRGLVFHPAVIKRLSHRILVLVGTIRIVKHKNRL